jgi:nucleotide-binding universal stress UspA family protein
MFKHVLVPTDGSLFSRDAVRKAVSIAKENGAKVSALYVKLPPPAHYWSHVIWVNLPEPSAFEDFSEKEAQEALGFVEGLCRDEGVECNKISVTHEHVYQAIIDEAAKNNCDLIFMASHGRRGVEALVLGSETHKVLTHSKIPVLVFR